MTYRVLSVLVPVFNEESSIEKILVQLLKVDLIDGVAMEIVIVDDYSSDLSVEIIRRFINNHPTKNIFLYSHEKK